LRRPFHGRQQSLGALKRRRQECGGTPEAGLVPPVISIEEVTAQRRHVHSASGRAAQWGASRAARSHTQGAGEAGCFQARAPIFARRPCACARYIRV
jgi:hypothetical protein